MPPQNPDESLEKRLEELAVQISSLSSQPPSEDLQKQVNGLKSQLARIQEQVISVKKNNQDLPQQIITPGQKILTPAESYRQGVQFFELKDYQVVIDSFNHALNYVPDYELAHNFLGMAYHESGNIPMAAKKYREAIRLDPEFKLFHNNLGRALMDLGNPEAAKIEFKNGTPPFLDDESIFALEETDKVAHDNLPTISICIKIHHESGDFEKVLECYRTSEKYFKNKGLFHLFFAEALYGYGQFREARSKYHTAIYLADKINQIGEEALRAHMGLAKVLETLGLFKDAISEYTLTWCGADNGDKVTVTKRLKKLEKMLV